jgi:hypothetical protein
MTITKTLGKIPTAVTDNNVDIAVLAQSDLDLISQEKSPDGLVRTATYVYAAGDPAQELTVIVRIASDKLTSKAPKRRVTIRLVSNQVIEDSVAGTTVNGDSIESFIGYVIPIDGSVAVADLRLLLSTVYGLTFDSVTSGAPSNALLTKTAFLTPLLY